MVRFLTALSLAAALLTLRPTAKPKPDVPTNLEPDGAPSRVNDGPGVPPPIAWPAPKLGQGPFPLETAEERFIRVVVVADGLQQPWSIAFLPEGDMLVTERVGRLRVVRDGKLDPKPVSGVPQVHAEGLQGLMDVVLHPRFDENRWVYLTYHKALATGQGTVTLARATWDGRSLMDVREIFESAA